MCIITVTLANGTTFITSNEERALEVFLSSLGRGATISYRKVEKK